MLTQSLKVTLLVVCCAAIPAKADIIHATATGPVAQIYWNLAGPSCLSEGDQFSVEIVSQIATNGDMVNPSFTGLRNGEHDGLPDWSDQFGMFDYPPREGASWEAGGRYQRRVGGDAVVGFGLSPDSLEWEWVIDQPLCMGMVGPISWSHETMFFDGDADQNGLFNSGDLVSVFVAGEYEDGITGNSTWETGDWTGDREFDSSDMVAAMIGGRYGVPAAAGRVQTPLGVLAVADSSSASAGVSVVPEPSALVLFSLGILLSFRRRK